MAGQAEAMKDIGSMFDRGLLKQNPDGSYEVVEDKNERDFIQESNRKLMSP